ncbi:Monocarboxylate transporter, partial [Temnothorax longispinosus]
MTENKKNDTKGQAPDGGWGWFVCLGSSLIALSLRSLDPSFGLLFKDLLEDLNVDSTGTSVIMSVLDAIVNFSGFLVGPLLKRYSYRQVAFFGSLLSCSGLIITSQADSMLYIICSYSVLGGLGTGLAMACSFIALNTFFDKKRGQAVGFSMAGTALAMMVVPLLIHMLLDIYGFRGTTLIVGGWALHSVIGSCLLRPLEERPSPPPVKKKPDKDREHEALLIKPNPSGARRMSNGSMWTKDQDTENGSISPKKESFMTKIKATFDLDLLKNFTYLNVVLGCSFVYVAESNFKLMTPFFLSDIGMTKAEVAFCLSLTAFTDILARLLLPTLFDKFGWKKRIVFWISSLFIGITRSILAEQSERTPLIVMFVIAGFLRGATLVNLNLCISECCTLKRLPSAFGIFMVFKGLCVVTMSPLIGYIRDVSDSYKICIHVMTGMILTTFIVWSIEFLYDVLLGNFATTGALLILGGIALHSLIGASLLRPFGKQKEIVLVDKITDISKEESSRVDNEANVENNAVQNRLLSDENNEEERQPNHRPKNSETEVKSRHTSFLRKIVANMDLDLLRDNRYIAIVLGMGVSLVAETNFNATIPFVLAELANLDRTSIATVMSIQAAADITGRLCVPLLAQKTGWTCRNLYVMSLLGSILGRTILSTWGDTYVIVIGVALIVGMAKGTKAVFQALIIPDYVPLERLPAASGIQMVCNGILSISVGPIIGLVHDSTDSYVGALYFTSFLSLSCVFLWSIGGLWALGRNTLKLNQRNPSGEQENSHENTMINPRDVASFDVLVNKVCCSQLCSMPPNGGWGWIIVLAGALSGLSTIPILQVFGLIFKDSFATLNLTATDTSVIINVNLAFGMILGLINGPLLKIYGYRRVALTGSIMYAVGVILTAFANSFALIIICYGFVYIAIGISMSMSAFSLATNSYFTTKRSRAVGMGMTVTGLGPILMPQIASFLLSYYGIQGTILILGAYSFHSMIGALLLHPIKWHMKNAPICLETIPENPKTLTDINDKQDTLNCYEEDESIHSSMPAINYQRKRRLTVSSIDHDVEVGSIYGFDTPLPRQISTDGTSRSRLNLSYDPNYDTEMLMMNARSVDSVHLGSSIKIFDEPIPITKKLTFVDNDVSKNNGTSQNVVEKDSLLEKEADKCSINENNDSSDKNNSACHRILQRVSDLYDFDLLRDPIYVNIMLGMSIAIFAEINFSMLTPFILADMGLTTAKIANVMSIIAIVDLVLRGAAPYLGEWLPLIFANSYATMVAVAIGLGAAKGIRSVYMVLVVPSYVPIQKLPNASGIQMLTNGLFLMSAGPMLGLLRDNTGNYTICIILLNCVTAITLCIWTIEMLIRRKSLARQKSQLSGTS